MQIFFCKASSSKESSTYGPNSMSLSTSGSSLGSWSTFHSKSKSSSCSDSFYSSSFDSNWGSDSVSSTTLPSSLSIGFDGSAKFSFYLWKKVRQYKPNSIMCRYSRRLPARISSLIITPKSLSLKWKWVYRVVHSLDKCDFKSCIYCHSLPHKDVSYTLDKRTSWVCHEFLIGLNDESIVQRYTTSCGLSNDIIISSHVYHINIQLCLIIVGDITLYIMLLRF